eukprot:PhF_6_TR15676/c0_g1_i1/m.24374
MLYAQQVWRNVTTTPALYKPSFAVMIRNSVSTRSTFVTESIIEDAIKEAEVPKDVEIPEVSAWRRLIDHLADKPFVSPIGSQLLRIKVVNALAQRLMLEERFKEYASEMRACEQPDDATFLIGIPRCHAHMLAHVMASTGCVLSPSTADTIFPGIERASERRVRVQPLISKFMTSNWDFPAVRNVKARWVEDDLHLHLMKPGSVAWGLLHTLDDHLREAIQDTNYMKEVFQFQAQVLRLFRVYREMNQFPELVDREIHDIDVMQNKIRWGPRLDLKNPPWVIHSPLAMCYLPELQEAFPKMKLVWVHRALAQCIPSMCASLIQHDIMYTHRTPMDSGLVQMGHKVMGFFGSGTEKALDFLATFPEDRCFLNISNRDLLRGSMRIVKKLFPMLGVQMDRTRMTQGINGYTSLMLCSAPRHVHQVKHFGITESEIGDVFKAYVEQFEDYAFEPYHGITRFIPPQDITTNIQQIPSFKFNAQKHAICFDPQGDYQDK